MSKSAKVARCNGRCCDCAVDCGVFKGSYAVSGPVDRHIPVDVRIPGCPPRPSEILKALAALRSEVDNQHQQES